MKHPNPGSQEALKEGCECPVIDNHFGKGVPGYADRPVFWMVESCPLHGYTVEHNHRLPRKGENNEMQPGIPQI